MNLAQEIFVTYHMARRLSSGLPTKRVSNQLPQLLNFACSKFTYDTLQKANKNGTDQSVQMCRLVYAFVVCKHKDKFSRVKAYIM